MTANVETLVYVREEPWHKFGTKVDHLMTAEECVVAAGLDWVVEKRPLFFRDPTHPKGTIKKIDERVATVRMSDGKYLGTVSPNYAVVQNRRSFDIADAIVETGEAKYETAGSLREGRVVFLSMEIPKQVKVPGDDGEIKPYLLLVNSHDGSFAFRGAVTPIRAVCENTVNMALEGAVSEFRLRHTSGIEQRVKEAQRALGLTFEYLDKFEAIATRMLLTKVTKRDVMRTLLQVFPIKDVNPLKLDAGEMERIIRNGGTGDDKAVTAPALKALQMYESSSNIDNIRGTAWGVYNGIAEYLDYGQFYRSRGVSAADNRASSILLHGPAAPKKEKAASLLAALSN
jgi:phage/plasmid-like protein (TIGR03299 family)